MLSLILGLYLASMIEYASPTDHSKEPEGRWWRSWHVISKA